MKYKKLIKENKLIIKLLPQQIKDKINNLENIKSVSSPLRRTVLDDQVCEMIQKHLLVLTPNQPVGKGGPKEAVNHPSHYGGAENPYEAIKVIEAWDLNFNLGNTVKYISRAGKKDAVLQELKKSAWYLQREIDNLEKKNAEYAEMEKLFGCPLSVAFGIEKVDINVGKLSMLFSMADPSVQDAIKMHKESFDKLIKLDIIKRTK